MAGGTVVGSVGSAGIGAAGGSTLADPDRIELPRENRGSTANFMLRLAEATGGRVMRADAGKDGGVLIEPGTAMWRHL